MLFARHDHPKHKIIVPILLGSTLALALGVASVQAQPYASPAAEMERAKLAEIVSALDQLVVQVDDASQTGASGRVRFNYDALRRDLLGRRALIQRYVNGAWDEAHDLPPLAKTYQR